MALRKTFINIYKKKIGKNKNIHEQFCLFSLSILKISNTKIYQFCYDSDKLKWGKKAKLCFMDIDIFIVHIKIEEDIYVDIATDVEIRFETSNYKLERPLQTWKYNWINGNWIRWKKMMAKFVSLGRKTSQQTLVLVETYWRRLQEHETMTNNPPTLMNISKIENRITFKLRLGIITGYYYYWNSLEALKPR